DAFKAAQHASRAAQHFSSQLRIRLIEPRREADAARHRIEFGHAEPVLGDEQIRPDDSRQLVFEYRRALDLDKLRGFSLIQPAGHPIRLFAFDALAVQKIDRAVKLEQDAAQGFQLFANFWAEWKWGGRDAP